MVNHFESYENDRYYPDYQDNSQMTDEEYDVHEEFQIKKEKENNKKERKLLSVIEYFRSIDDRFDYVDLSHVYKDHCDTVVYKNDDEIVDEFSDIIVEILFNREQETTYYNRKSVKKQIIANVIDTIDRHYIY